MPSAGKLSNVQSMCFASAKGSVPSLGTTMKLPRRQFLHLAAGAAALPAVSRIAGAQTYPTRAVRIIVGLPAGSSSDIGARLMGQWLAERLGQPFVIENRPGAGQNIAAETVVRAPPDGYMLLLANTANATNPALYDRLSFNFIRDIAPVAGIIRVPQVMLVTLSLPTKTVPEFIAYAKANPGNINMASVGVGSAQHIAGELFKFMAGVDIVHVPYRSNPRPDLLGGQVEVMFDTIPSSIELIRAGKVRALAVTTVSRYPALPDVPTVGEFVTGYEASAWQGIGAPTNTPEGIVERLNKEINVGLADAKLKARLEDLGALPMPMTPAEFAKLIVDETEKWGKVVKFAGIKPE
jgi:tripartite-type tricarboxylate transporter receptor subunit TctC